MPPFALTRDSARRSSLLIAVLAYAARLGVAAAEPSEPVATASLELDADASCATQTVLISRVRSRSPRARFVDDGSGLAIRVQISTTSSGAAAGKVTLANPGTTPSIRHVLARSCSEAVDAVALIIAVTLDPTSMAARDTPTASKGDAAAAADTSSSADGNAQPRAAQESASPSAGGASVAENESGFVTPPRSRASFGLQLAMDAFFGVAPGVMPGVALYAIAGFDRPSLWSPSVALGVRHAWRSELQEPGGNASFTLDALTLDACPVRFRWRAIQARPCGSLLFGRLVALGEQTFNPAAESLRPFWVIGGAALVTADLPARILVSARFALGANLVRDSFEFTPALFHEIPPLSAAAGVGIGMRWD